MVSESHKKRQKVSNYTGYTISSDDQAVEELTERINGEEFFNRFIKQRQPVKIDKSLNDFIDPELFDVSKVVETLDCNDALQVERKHEDGFGSGKKREKMGFAQFVDEIKGGKCEYYLTTQYDFDDPEEEADGSSAGSSETAEVEDSDLAESGDIKENECEKSAEGKDLEEEEGSEDEPIVGESFAGFDVASQASSVDSFDATNLHDDFDDFDDVASHDDEVVDEEWNITSDEVTSRARELLQPPLTKIHNKMSLRPYLFETLVPQQINLWMGCTNSKKPTTSIVPDLGLGRAIPGTGVSSGLHHDHADNLYILLSGCKRFTLFSPVDAEKLFTVGSIYRIYNNGLIDYKTGENSPHWKRTREDGALVSEICRWKLENEDFSEETRDQLMSILEREDRSKEESRQNIDPPSFSKVPPSLLHIDEFPDKTTRDQLIRFANRHFPGFLDLKKMTVWLHGGDMLYLPCGWFHEVTSFSPNDNSDISTNAHMAVNYWFAPPDTDTYDAPYADNYWPQDWQRTHKCISLLQKGIVHLH